MLYKTTTRLFKGQYQYKIVLVCPAASWFRNGMEDALTNLQQVDLKKPVHNAYRNTYIKTQDQLDYALKLHSTLNSITDIDIRVESPWISIYSNSKSSIDKLANIDQGQVKYVVQPANNIKPADGEVIMPKMPFDYRCTLGKTTQEHDSFVSWAESNKKLKLTKSCKRDLLKPRSWGGTHFYVAGDNNLLLAKMHLGGSISKVERIIKA